MKIRQDRALIGGALEPPDGAFLRLGEIGEASLQLELGILTSCLFGFLDPPPFLTSVSRQMKSQRILPSTKLCGHALYPCL